MVITDGFDPSNLCSIQGGASIRKIGKVVERASLEN